METGACRLCGDAARGGDLCEPCCEDMLTARAMVVTMVRCGVWILVGIDSYFGALEGDALGALISDVARVAYPVLGVACA